MPDRDRPLRIGIWCAVSSRQQVTDKISLDDQAHRGRQFSEAVGGQVVATYTVPGHTRDLIFYTDAEAEMDAYLHLHQDIDAARLDVLWALDVDRLGRDPALGQQVISLVEKHGAEVYLESAPHTLGHKTAGHRYITAIQAVRAGEDQQRRIHHHRIGMTARVRRGLLPGRAPLGYDTIRDPAGRTVEYRLNTDAYALRTMTDLLLAGHPYAEIRRRMNAGPHPPPAGARAWHYSLVYRCLNNDVYAGLPTWGSAHPDQPSPHVEPLWDPKTFAAVVRERQARARGYTRRGAGPLTGVAICARCGAAMSRLDQRRQVYLRCATHSHRSTTGVSCHANNIPEQIAIDALVDILADLHTRAPDALDHLLVTLDAPADETRARRDLAAARRRIDDLDHQRRRLALALAAGQLDPAMYRHTDDQLLTNQDAARTRADELVAYLNSLPDLPARRAALAAIVQDYQDLLHHTEPATAARRLQEAGLQLLIENRQVLGLQLK